MTMHFLLASEDSSLHSTLVVLIMFNLYKRIINYDRAKLKKVGSFYVRIWLIFAGPVTYAVV